MRRTFWPWGSPMTWNTTSAQTAPKNAPPINEMKRVAFVISHNGEVSDGNQPPMTFHLSLNESVGSRSLDRFVERSRYAACKSSSEASRHPSGRPATALLRYASAGAPILLTM